MLLYLPNYVFNTQYFDVSIAAIQTLGVTLTCLAEDLDFYNMYDGCAFE